jgi:glycolate oxidase FAD binding subunit
MSNAGQFVSALAGMVGESNVIQDADQLNAHAVDGLTPKAVVNPGSVEEIAKVLAFAGAERLAVVPWGSGTKMAMGGIPRRVDLVLSTLRINRITEYDEPNLSLSVQAGATLAEVQKTLASTGKGSFLPLDPPAGAQATIGGIIATNSSGPRRYLYNSARDLLLGLKAVLPNGDICAFGGKTVKNVSGYDMTKLMVGSFGSLGIITEITTKLLPLPEASATLLASFADLVKAGSLLRAVLHSVLLPSAMELLDEKAAGSLGHPARYLVAFSLEGVGEAVDRQVAEIVTMAKKDGAMETRVLRGEEDRLFWVGLRDFGLAPGTPLILKANVAISKLVPTLAQYEKTAQAAGAPCAFIGHAGNGILTVFCGDGSTQKPGQMTELIARFTAEAVRNAGNLVVESCPRELKEKVSVWGEPRSDYSVMRRLKETVDPAGVLNPGRFVGGI